MWEPPKEEEDHVGSEEASSKAMPGMFVVISGVVRLDLEVEGRDVPMFLGSGEAASKLCVVSLWKGWLGDEVDFIECKTIWLESLIVEW